MGQLMLLPLLLNLEAESPAASAIMARRRLRVLLRKLGFAYFYGYER